MGKAVSTKTTARSCEDRADAATSPIAGPASARCVTPGEPLSAGRAVDGAAACLEAVGEPRGWGARLERIGRRVPIALLLALGGLYLAAFLVYAAVVVAWPLPYDQGEGFVLHDAQRAVARVPLYTSNEAYPFYSSNYPPGFPLLLARLAPLTGLDLTVGRAVSVASALVAALAIGVVVARTIGGIWWPGAALAALLFLASPYTYGLAPLFKSDLPALAAGLVALALVACLPAGWRTPRPLLQAPRPATAYRPGAASVVGGALGWLRSGPAGSGSGADWSFLLGLALALPLLVGALWTKPLSAACAGAVIGWAVLRRPAVGAAAGALFGAACVAVLWWLDRRSAGAFSLNFVSGNFSEWRWVNLPDLYGRFLLVNVPLVLIAVLWLRRTWRAPVAWLPGLCLLGGAGIALGVGIWGAGSSYLLYLLAALAIVAGVALTWLRGLSGEGSVRLLLLAQLALYFHLPGVALPFNDLRHPTAGTLPDPADIPAAGEIVAWLQEGGGPVYTEDGYFALAAGFDLVGNPTTLVELDTAGRWRGDALIAMFDRREFRTVVIGPHMLPPRMLDAIARNYGVIDGQTVHGIRYLIAKPRP